MTFVRSAGAVLLLLLGLIASVGGQEPSYGLPVPPLGPGPFVFDSAEHPKIRVTVLARGLVHPWAIVFLPDGAMLVTERPGRLRTIRNGILDPDPIAGVPAVRTDGNGGLMDVALHPRFTENRLRVSHLHETGRKRARRTRARARAPRRTHAHGRSGSRS